jgi:hypothetical protein
MMFESPLQVIRGADVVLVGFQAKKDVDGIPSRKNLDKKRPRNSAGRDAKAN